MTYTTADYDLYVKHNTDWVFFGKKQTVGAILDVDSGVKHDVENMFWPDPNEAKGQYVIQVTCNTGSCNEEWTLNVYLDGNLYKTYKGKHQDGGEIISMRHCPGGSSCTFMINWSHTLDTFSY